MKTKTENNSKRNGKNGRPERCMARSSVYGLLSLAFSYPDEETARRLRRQAMVAIGASRTLPEPVRDCLRSFASALDAADDAALEAEYLRVFTHVASADCHPCETAYTSRHVFQVSQQMADISGFYLAFGMEPNGERADHISVETSFLGLLALKEGYACAHHGRGKADICRRASRTFLSSHLGRWAPVFVRFLSDKAKAGPYAELARLAQAFLTADARSLRVRPVEVAPDRPLLTLAAAGGEEPAGSRGVFGAEPAS